jgi:hypothetical protein
MKKQLVVLTMAAMVTSLLAGAALLAAQAAQTAQAPASSQDPADVAGEPHGAHRRPRSGRHHQEAADGSVDQLLG